MQFLVGDGECSFSEKNALNLRIVEARSKAEAIRAYKTILCCQDEALHEFIIDGFDGKFWIVTSKENAHFDATGEVLASKELFQRRVRIYFDERNDLAEAYLHHYFNDAAIRLPTDMLNAISEFILIKKNEYVKIDAICMTEIISLNGIKNGN